MTHNKKFLFSLLALGLLWSCTQTPEQNAKNATVLMVTGSADRSIGTGSGFFVEHDKIVTNIHVVDSAKVVFAVGRKKVYNIEKVNVEDDRKRDLVILRVSGKGKPLELSEAQIDEGDPISAVGYPGGGYKVTKGEVHGIRNSDQQLRLVPEDFPPYRDDPVLVGGNSGGPVLNSEWQVVGIASRTETEVFDSASASSALNALLDSLAEENLLDWQKRSHICAYAYQSWAKEKSDSENYHEAIEGYDKAIEEYDGYAHAYRGRGDAKRGLGRYQAGLGQNQVAIDLYEAAIKDYTDAIRLIPDDFRAYYRRGIAKAEKPDPDYEGAIQDYTKAINPNPKDAVDVVAYLNRGLAKAKKPDPDYAGAIDDYDQAIKLNPNLGTAYDRRGDAKKALGQDGDAKRDYAKAYYYWGRKHSASRKYQEAIKAFDESLELNPDSAETYYARGDARWKKDEDSEGAIQDYTKAINQKRDFAEAYYARGIMQLRGDDRDYQAAVADFEVAVKLNEVAVKLNPDDAKAYQNLAKAYRNLGGTRYLLGEYKVAIDSLDKAIELKPTYAGAYKTRGFVKEALKDENAKQDFARADYHSGNEAYKSGQYQEAIKHFNASLELAPVAPFYDARGNAKMELAKSKADLGDRVDAPNLYKEAIEDRDKAIELESKNARFYHAQGNEKEGLESEKVLSDYYKNRGVTKLLRGAIRDHNGAVEDYQGAIEDLTSATKWKSDFADAYYLRGKVRCLLGYAKANQGRSKEAREQYKLALEDFKEAVRLANVACDKAQKDLDEAEKALGKAEAKEAVVEAKKAVAEAKKAVKLALFDNASYHRGLGLANAALGKAEATIEAFAEAKELREKGKELEMETEK